MSPPASRLCACLALGVALLLTCWGQAPAQEKDKQAGNRWEKTIQAFERQDEKMPPPKGAVLFVGSSSIRLWNLSKSFPDLQTINRGFGGSEIADSVHFVPRIVTKYEPRIIVFYAGDNDLAAGKTPDRLLEDFQAFAKAVQAALPKTKILFLPVKPSLARRKLLDRQRQANGLIEAYCKTDPRLQYVDVATPMLGADGSPRPELFAKDGLHLNEEGYRLWASVLRPYLKQGAAQ